MASKTAIRTGLSLETSGRLEELFVTVRDRHVKTIVTNTKNVTYVRLS